ncbi:MAG: hypothetical protein MK108_15325 [Mariniblastus sp.]|nr:hypothetical protein [Mariniblastus sp.]
MHAPENHRDQPFAWGPLTRGIVSLVIAFYLAVVLLGPLANPIGSEALTIPLSRAASPVHQTLYLGHGYRFFGPDPGPGHLLAYRIETTAGELIEGQFPDRGQHWPRLLYHRWFMLSETVYDHFAFTPTPEAFQESLQEVQREMDVARSEGAPREVVEQLELRQWNMRRDYDLSSRRFDVLIRGIAGYLMQKHDGQTIQLFCLERLIPLPVDVRAGSELNDPRYLSVPQEIAEFTRSELFSEESQ